MKKKWLGFGALFLVCCFGIFSFANSMAIPWLYKINYYFSSQHETYSDGYLKSIATEDRAFINEHVTQALSSLQERNEYEIAGAINDYLFQFLLRNPHWGEPVQVLKDEEAICGGNAHVMSAMLSECGIKNRIAYMLDIPYQGSHCLIEISFKDGTQGLFDPTFGLYWFDVEKNVHLSMEDLKKTPALAGTKILKTTHSKRQSRQDAVSSFTSIHSHYQPYIDRNELHFEEMFSRYSNAGVEGNSFKIFQKICIDGSKVLGEKSSKNIKAALASLCSEKSKNGEPISCIHQLGKASGGQHLDISHIYELKNLEKNKPYTLTLYYFKSINSVLSSTIINGKFSNTTKLTHHEIVGDFGPKLLQIIPVELPGKSRTITLNFIPDKSNVNIVIDNSGEMILHAISIEPIQ